MIAACPDRNLSKRAKKKAYAYRIGQTIAHTNTLHQPLLRAPEDNFLDLAECLFGTVDPRDGSHCSDLRSRVSFSLFTALGAQRVSSNTLC